MTIACPTCHGPTSVYDSRCGLNGWWKRRRRCLECYRRFTTLEMPAQSLQAEVELIVGEVVGNAAAEVGVKMYRRMAGAPRSRP